MATHALVVYEGFPYLSAEDIESLDRIVPRDRRAVIEADGHWGSRVTVGDDDNTWPCGAETWHEHLRDAGALVLQPALGPPAEGAVAFPYFGLPPRATRTARPWRRRLHVQYVGSNWFRAEHVLEVMAAARRELGSAGRLRVCGTYWDGTYMDGFPAATYVDPGRLQALDVDVRPPVPFGEVVERMGDAALTPVLVRPVLRALRFLTPRMLETAAADTIPAYREEDGYIGELYGDEAGDFRIDAGFFERAARERKPLAKAARGIHDRLAERFSYPVLLRQLRGILESD